MSGPNRRAIGHGALAERALLPALPLHEEFPYTVRLVAEVFASNGSTSMASVCAGSLALRDGGVPARPAAGISVGLIEEHGKIQILTDIQGAEDHYGDMDFKVAGTHQGITALQLDVKNEGIDLATAREALTWGMKAIHDILGMMDAVLPEPRPDLKQSAKESLALAESRHDKRYAF